MRRLTIIIALAGVLALVSLALLPRPLFGGPDEAGAGSRRVLVLANPIHSDIALPPDLDVLERFGFLAADGLPLDNPGVAWLLFGWGGRSFYIETPTWSELKPGPVFRALTVDSSVMHIDLAGPIPESFEGALAIDLSPVDFEKLLDAIDASFQRSQNGSPIVIPGRSYGDFDLFYDAHGLFNAVVGCNTWTARVLRAAGLRTSWWNPLPQNLFWSLRRYNRLATDVPPNTSQSSGLISSATLHR